jgi:CRISPR/Cas system-associated exonuclease Cas4 (RecB family)
MGIKLHQAFEGAETRSDIFDTLDKMAIDGEVSHEEVASLKTQISDTLNNSVAGEWFDGSWQKLHRERNILLPNSTSKRPDRVMTRGNEAVVVDYKFGEESNAYHRQIAEYITILQQMGYSTVRGYIWYVPTGKIVQIEK